MDKKILIIDDEPAIVMFIAELLSDMGYDTLRAYNGAEGLRILNSIPPPDLVITDLKMHEVSGQEVVKKIRANPKFDGMPVVIITGSAYDESDLPDANNFQAIFYKPFDIEEFLSSVKHLAS